jgi:transposase
MRGVERNSEPEWTTSGVPFGVSSPSSHRELPSPWRRWAIGIGSSTKSPVLAGQAREEAGCAPLLAHAAKAKLMMGHVHKTDKLDAGGLATLLHMGTLPAVWIPPGDLRDERELPRTRMAFSKVRTMLKNRIHSTLAKYALSLDTQSDIFTPKWRPQLSALLQQLPPETRRCVEQELELLELLQAHIQRLEARILQRVEITRTIQWVMSIPGPAEIPWPAARAGCPS